MSIGVTVGKKIKIL